MKLENDVRAYWKYYNKKDRWIRMSKFVYYQNYWYWKEIANEML